MKTLQEIRSDLNNILISLNVEGPVLTALSELLARSVYENEVNLVSNTLESSSSRCLNLNSSIVHAMDKGYSVFRGTNQKIKIWNITPATYNVSSGDQKYLSVKKFDSAYDIDGMKLVYASDGMYQLGQTINEDNAIELILCESVKSYNTTLTNTDLVKFDVPVSNISENLSIYSNGSGEFQEYNWSSKFKDIFMSSTLLVLTNSGYSVRILSSNMFSPGEEMIVKFIPYTTRTLTQNTLNNLVLPQFSNIEPQNSYISVINPVERVTDKDMIYRNSTEEFLSNYVIRSNADITKLIDEYFTTNQIFNDFKIVINIQNNIINIYYTTDLQPESPGPNPPFVENSQILTAINNFETLVQKAYYIDEELNFQRAKPVSYELNIMVYYIENLPNTHVSDVIKKYNDKVGEDFNLYRLLADIQESPYVYYCQPNSESSTPIFTVKLEDNQHLNITANVGYQLFSENIYVPS